MPLSRRHAQDIVFSCLDSRMESARTFLGDYAIKPQSTGRPLYAAGPSTHRFFFRTLNPKVYLGLTVNAEGTVNGPILHTTTDACILLGSTRETRSAKLQSLVRSVPFRRCSVPDRWYLQGRLRYPGTVNEHAEELLSRLGAGASQLRQLTRQGIVEGWFCLVIFYPKHRYCESESWILKPEILQQIAALGIRLNVQHAAIEILEPPDSTP